MNLTRRGASQLVSWTHQSPVNCLRDVSKELCLRLRATRPASVNGWSRRQVLHVWMSTAAEDGGSAATAAVAAAEELIQIMTSCDRWSPSRH